MGPCYACQRVFSYSPSFVPSVLVDGEREPICRDCVERANPRRAEMGLAPIVPHPNAYEPEEGG
jgi:hypothetical protein